jgi:hypothetical protein
LARQPAMAIAIELQSETDTKSVRAGKSNRVRHR